MLTTGRKPNQKFYMQYPRTLVLSPTRELALQISKQGQELVQGMALSVATLYGGVAVKQQIQELANSGCDLLVATPGRLLEVINSGKIDLSDVEYLILDEADRMLEMGFEDDVRNIAARIKQHPQTLLFSATFPKPIKKIVMDFMRDHVFIKVGKTGAAVASIQQMIYHVKEEEKFGQLVKLLRSASGRNLVFVERIIDTQNVADGLAKKGFKALAMHSRLSQIERETYLAKFRDKEAPILISTSLMARGIDISDVSQVINFDLPKSIDDYVHRIGRTGRIGQNGVAISFFTEKDAPLAPHLIRKLQETGQKIPGFLEQFN